MLSITPPTETATDSFAACISIVENPGLRRRLECISGYIERADSAFQAHARTATLYMLRGEDGVDGSVTTEEMKQLYESRMVRRNTPGRRIYDIILSSAPRGLCPLCAHRTANTLDHHLPKAIYPALAVAPANLVPACGECNKVKLSEVPRTARKQTLHPYFDAIDSEPWLTARVVQEKPTAAVFFVAPPATWSLVLQSRVKHHFKTLKLDSLYASQAATELAAIRHRLTKLFAVGGAEAVQEHLKEDAESRNADRLNSWMTALYKAWAGSSLVLQPGLQLTLQLACTGKKRLSAHNRRVSRSQFPSIQPHYRCQASAYYVTKPIMWRSVS